MYSAQKTIERIQVAIKEKGLTQKFVLSECGINENTVKRMTDNKGISSFYLAKIADYLDCSVDYLLGRTDNPKVIYENIHFSNIVNGNNGDNSPLTVAEDEMTQELVKAFQSMSFPDKMEIMNAVLEKAKK